MHSARFFLAGPQWVERVHGAKRAIVLDVTRHTSVDSTRPSRFMARPPLDPDEALAAPFYFFAALLVVLPLIDFVQNVGTFQPANVQWRFATVGLLSGFLLTPTIGIVAAMTIAAVRGQGRTQRAIAIGNVILAVLLLALMAGFVLDALQLRGSVPAVRRAEFRTAAIRAIVKYILTSLLLIVLAMRAFRIPLGRKDRTSERKSVPLVNR